MMFLLWILAAVLLFLPVIFKRFIFVTENDSGDTALFYALWVPAVAVFCQLLNRFIQ